MTIQRSDGGDMRKIFLHINVSLDGFIEDEHHDIDWHFADQEFDAYINEVLRSIDGMIFGRRAYELLAEYWPTAGSRPGATAAHVESAALMNALPKYLVSHHDHRTTWHNSHVISGRDVSDQVRELKVRPGKDLALFAGAGLAQSFVDLGLVDEYRLIVNPVLLGRGTRLFAGGHQRADLRLTDVRRFASGALVLTYDGSPAPRV